MALPNEEEVIARAYNAAALALQELEHLGQDLILVQPIAPGPAVVSGTSAMLAREDGVWNYKAVPRKG